MDREEPRIATASDLLHRFALQVQELKKLSDAEMGEVLEDLAAWFGEVWIELGPHSE